MRNPAVGPIMVVFSSLVSFISCGCGQPGKHAVQAGSDSAVTGVQVDAAVDSSVQLSLDASANVDGASDAGPHDVDAGSDAAASMSDAAIDAAMNVPLIEATGGKIQGEGFVELTVDSNNSIVSMQTTLVVPDPPAASGTLFLWPGLQPGGANYLPIDNGVLQPVLTWGGSCAPGKQPPNYTTWWVSAQYVNTFGKEPGYTGCHGGSVMSVGVTDELIMTMAQSGTIWKQTVVDKQTQQQVTFDIDMKGQAQNRAEWVIEGYSSKPTSEVIFNDSTIVFAKPSKQSCAPVRRGGHDFMSMPVPSADGLSCFVKKVILRDP